MPCGSLSISCCLSYQRYRTYQIVFKTDPMCPNPTKILLECSLDPSKSSQNPPRIDPMEHQKASWGPLWTSHGKKPHFEHQKNAQVGPNSIQERRKRTENQLKFQCFSDICFNVFFEAILPYFFDALDLENMFLVKAKR